MNGNSRQAAALAQAPHPLDHAMKKIIFCARSDLLTQTGGDTIQVLNTKAALENAYGLEIVLALEAPVIAHHRDADLVHIFNIQTIESSLAFAHAAEAAGLPIALSPVYWNLWPSAFVERVRSIAPYAPIKASRLIERTWRLFLHGSRFQASLLGRHYVAARRLLIEKAGILLPNSPQELAIIGADLRVGMETLGPKARVVPNAVDTRLWQPGEEGGERHASVAIVGRIEPTKNQLDLIRALAPLRDIPLKIIGRFSANPLHRRYCDAVKREIEAHPHVHLVHEVPHHEVIKHLRQVKVHVLPSFRESPGLTTIEALFAGCNIVTSGPDHCPVEYYGFDKLGTQCDPFSAGSMRRSILHELNAPRPRPPGDYFEFFSYKNAAKLTEQAYRQLISQRHGIEK